MTIEQAVAYSPEQRSQAKTLAVALGDTEKAREYLAMLWLAEDVALPVPSVHQIAGWRRSSKIVIDRALLADLMAELRAEVAGSAMRVLAKSESALIAALNAGEHLAASRYTMAWSAAADRLTGRGGSAAEQGQQPVLPQLPPGARGYVTWGYDPPALPPPAAIEQVP